MSEVIVSKHLTRSSAALACAQRELEAARLSQRHAHSSGHRRVHYRVTRPGRWRRYWVVAS